MENLHNDDKEDNENDLDLFMGKTKKKAKDLGSVLFKPKAEQQSEDSDEPKKWWELLDSGYKQDDQEQELDEEEPVLAEISPEETHMIEHELAVSKLMAEEAAPAEFDENVAAEQAVNHFRQKIVSEGMMSDEALVETINELDVKEPQPEAELTPAHASELHYRTGIDKVEKPEPTPEVREQPADRKADHVVSGFTDYMFEKRRDKLRTVEKPEAVRKKLEKHVREIRANLDQKENKIRQLAAETKREQPERIKQQYQKTEASKEVETLTRQELLAKSEKIIVDSTNLRQVYETHLITERGLRRIIAEYERGGDYKHQLKSELLEHQIDFERDPQMRDKQRDNTVIAGGKAALNSMLAKVDSLSADQAKDELAFYKAREMHRTLQQKTTKKRRRTADLLMGATISVLLALVLIMLLTRG